MTIKDIKTGMIHFVYGINKAENIYLIIDYNWPWYFCWSSIDNFEVIENSDKLYFPNKDGILFIEEFLEDKILLVCLQENGDLDNFLQFDLQTERYWALKYASKIAFKYKYDSDYFKTLMNDYSLKMVLEFISAYLEKAQDGLGLDRIVRSNFYTLTEFNSIYTANIFKRSIVEFPKKDVFYHSLELKQDYEIRKIDLLISAILDSNDYKIYYLHALEQDGSIDYFANFYYLFQSDLSCIFIEISKYENE